MGNYYKAAIVVAVVLLTLGWMLLDRTSIVSGDEPDTTYHQTAATVPEATFTLMDGKTLSLHSLKGHTVWLHFWASWCAPCRKEFPALLARLAKEDNNTVLLAVSGDANAEDAERFLTPFRRDFKALFASGRVITALDADHAISQGIFQTFQYPETIIIGPDLAMREKVAGVFGER